MNLWENITGSDLKRALTSFEARVNDLPADYQAAWEEINDHLWEHADFTGRNLLPIADGVLGLLEETAADGQSVQDVLGDDIKGFCSALAGAEGAQSYRDKWRAQLNHNIAPKIRPSEDKMRIQELTVRIQAALAGKQAWQETWRAHLARVKALTARVKALPPDYQIVYREIESYFSKVGLVELTAATDLLSGIVDLFQEGAALGKGVLEVTGRDVAAFCDELIKDSRTFADIVQEAVDQEVNKAKQPVIDKTK